MNMRLSSCVMVDDYGRILLLHRQADGPSGWELPGGEIGTDETAVGAATRAVESELGLGIELVKPLDVGLFEIDGDSAEFAWFQAVITEADPQLHDTRQFDDLAYFELEDLQSLSLAPSARILADKLLSGELVLAV